MTMYYVQRTTVQILAIEAESPELALEAGREIQDADWAESIDTENDYIVLDASGKLAS